MRNLFLLYMPPGNAEAMVHYEETIRQRVELRRVSPFLSRSEIRTLQEIFGERRLAVWGSRDSSKNRFAFAKMRPGDDVLIVEGKTVRFAGKIALKTENPQLSRELWQNLGGTNARGWDLVYFIANPIEIQVPFPELCGLLGYERNFQLKGLTPVRDERVEAFSAHYGDLQSVLEQLNVGRPLQRVGVSIADIATEPDAESVVEPLAAASDHVRMQHLLADLGRRAGDKVWVPRSDQGRLRRHYPDVQFEAEFASGIDLPKSSVENIDVVWREEFRVKAAFEVEHSTAIYSGLLRFADLQVVAPNSNYPMFIVAPQERKNQVRDQVMRPVFRKLDLRERVLFLPYRAVEDVDRFFANSRSGLTVDVLVGQSEPLV